MRSLYRNIVPYELRFWLYKQRNREHFRRLRTLVHPSSKGNFSLRQFDKLKCIFVHITKTAGTSVASALFSELPYHYTAVQYRVIFGRKDFNTYFKFAFVRNPWARLYSAWNFLGQGGWNEKDAAWAADNIKNIVDFNDFVCEWLNEERLFSHVHFWPQTCFITDRSGKCLLDYIGYFEELTTDFALITNKLNINSELPHINTSGNADYRDIYSTRSIEKVSSLYKNDIYRLGYTFDGFTRKTPWEKLRDPVNRDERRTALLVANWKSDVGYAWWLMESFWVSISKALDNNFKFILAYPELSQLPTNILTAPVLPVECDFNNRSPGGILKTLKFIKQNKITWIYFTDKPAFDWIYPLYRLVGVRAIIIHDHTPGTRLAPGALKKIIKRLISVTSMAADGLIAVTDFVNKRHLMVNCFPPDKCYVADNGIQPWGTIPRKNSHEYFHIPDERKIMVMTGRANRYKGVEFVLDCMNEMINKRNNKTVHFLYCGDGPDLEFFRHKAREYNIQDFVSFPGYCDNIRTIISGSDFAIHASRGEVGYSLSILEYMYAKLPVLVPSNPSVCGATEDGVTGFIYRENDIISAVELISSVAEHPDILGKIGEKARDTVINKYNISNTHKQLIESVTKVLIKKNLL